MKKLMLVAKQLKVLNLYLSTLENIFDGYLEIVGHVTVDEDPLQAHNKLVQSDIILITNPYSFPYVRQHMKENASIINLLFTFEKERIEKLREFPIGTEALICFNYYSSSHQAAKELYDSGLKNINIYIHYPGNKNISNKKIDIALISNYAEEIPEHINDVFDLGPRRISFATILEIAVSANVLDEILEKRIYDYCLNSANSGGFLSNFYDRSSVVKHQLKAVTNCIDDGLLIFDSSGTIFSHNEHLNTMFNFQGDISGKKITQLPQFSTIKDHLCVSHDFKNKLVTDTLTSKNLAISKEKMNKVTTISEIYVAIIKDVTELTKLEGSMRKQISKKGHVAKYSFNNLLGASTEITNCIRKAKKISNIDKPTLIIGETGTGKELFAQSIHNLSNRKIFPFIGINCAALPSELLESELFGYEEGAFSGAKKGGKQGLFQMANKGTLFLDEIGEMSMTTQAKILRVLEEQEIMKIGGGEIISVDVRIIAATNRNLQTLIDEGKFRLDLFYRLNTLIIKIPPLRNRCGDIPFFIQNIIENSGYDDIQLSPDLVKFFNTYEWRGNIRELKNCLEYMIYTANGILDTSDLPDYILDNLEKNIPQEIMPISQEIKSNLISQSVNINPIEAIYHKSILTILEKKSLGRRRLCATLNSNNIKISEYKLRLLLGKLEYSKLISYGEGRSGITITPEGIAYLSSLR